MFQSLGGKRQPLNCWHLACGLELQDWKRKILPGKGHLISISDYTPQIGCTSGFGVNNAMRFLHLSIAQTALVKI